MLMTYYHCLNQYKGKQWKLYSNSAESPSDFMFQVWWFRWCVFLLLSIPPPSPSTANQGRLCCIQKAQNACFLFASPTCVLEKNHPVFSEQALNKRLRHEIWSLSNHRSELCLLASFTSCPATTPRAMLDKVMKHHLCWMDSHVILELFFSAEVT